MQTWCYLEKKVWEESQQKHIETKDCDKYLKIFFKDLDIALINASFITGFFGYINQEMPFQNVLF